MKKKTIIYWIEISCFDFKIKFYGKPVPVIVRVVPPPVPPLCGLTEETVGVRAALYANEDESVLFIEFTDTITSHVESTWGVVDPDVYKFF